MNRWTRRLLMAASLVGFASTGVGCADEREPINRVQPQALDKSFFVGSLADELDNPVFFSKAFVIDQSAGQNGISVGLYSGTDRIKWEVSEEYLIAHKAYQIAQGQDDHGKPEGAPNGTVVAKFAITGHFDIKRSYNPQTGEELNVVEENTSDRPWYQRQYMRVDWSSNQVVDPMWGEIFFGKIFGDLTVEPLTYTVTDPQSEDAPYFDVKDGYFDVTNKYYTSPKEEYFAPWDETLPTCALVGIFTSSTTSDCNNQEATVRHSFWKVKADHDFEPTENTKRKMDVVANFGGAGDSFQPGFAGGTTQCWDPQYAYTDACFHQYLVKTNFWAKSHTTTPCNSDYDGDNGGAGNGTADECETASTTPGSQCDTVNHLCTIPLRERSIKPVGFWLNKETPADLLDAVDADGNPTGALDQQGQPVIRGPMEDVVHTWNQAMMTSLAYGREVECRRTGGGDRAFCHSQFFVVDGGGNDQLQMLSFGGWGIATPKPQPQDGPYAMTSCHAPVRAYDLHDVCGPTGEVARNGDQRKNFIYYWPYDSDARYGGVAGLGQDPETGESHGVTATVMGRSATRAAANYRDYIQYALGDFSTTDFNNGVPQFIYNKMQQNGYSPMSPMAAEAAGKKFSPPSEKPAAAPAKAGDIQAKDNVLQPSLSKFLQAQTKTAYDPLLQGQTQPMFEALAGKVRGTEWEAAIVDPTWAMQTTGANPDTVASSGNMLESSSPLRNLDSGRLAMWRAQIEAKLAAKGVCFVEDVPRVGSINWAGISRWYLDKFEDMGMASDIAGGGARDPVLVKQRGEYIYNDLFKGMARGIAIHEVGHCLGMRHNFASSYDAPNFMPQYWQLRTNEGQAEQACGGGSDPATCMGRRYQDPETEDEQGLALRDSQGRSQGRPAIGYFGNTSVMEYEQDYLSPGFGTYDLAYLKAVYGGVLETYDIDRVDQGGIAEPDQDQFAANIGLQLSELNILGPNIAHYTDLSRDLRVFNPAYCRDASPDEITHGEWRVVHGKICGQSPRDHYRWKDFINDNDDGAEMPFSWLNLTAWKTRRATTGDNRVRNRWNYRYGETYGNGYLHTNPSDNGADTYEVTVSNNKMFDLTYPISYFRRQNKEYHYKPLPWSTANRFLERARSFHWILQDRGTSFGGEFEIARLETFHFLARAAMLPEPGPQQAFSAGGETLYRPADASIQFPSTFQVGVGDGRYVSDEFSNVDGGNWDYLAWINHAAYNAERGMAVRALFDGRPTLFTISPETYLDGRNVLRNFRDDIPQGVDRLLGGLLSEDWTSVAMWVSNEDIQDPAGGLPFRSVQMFDLTVDSPSRPAGSAAMFPNIGYRQQVWMIINANLFGRMNSDLTLLNKMAIYIEGIDFLGAIPDAELIKFTDPNSGFTYVARMYGPETINGKTKDKGIASRMLQHANDLKANDPSSLKKYVGLLDAARGVSKLFSPYGIGQSIPDPD